MPAASPTTRTSHLKEPLRRLAALLLRGLGGVGASTFGAAAGAVTVWFIYRVQAYVIIAVGRNPAQTNGRRPRTLRRMSAPPALPT